MREAQIRFERAAWGYTQRKRMISNPEKLGDPHLREQDSPWIAQTVSCLLGTRFLTRYSIDTSNTFPLATAGTSLATFCSTPTTSATMSGGGAVFAASVTL